MPPLVLQRDLIHVEQQGRRPSFHVLGALHSGVFLGSIHVTKQGRDKSSHVLGYMTTVGIFDMQHSS